MKTKAIQALKNWSENAILMAEIDESPRLDTLHILIANARTAGLTDDEIGALIWTPYADELTNVRRSL